jgi:hypothetical protein
MAQSFKELDEQEQLLLMRYHDGECSFLERVMAERLLRNSEVARRQIESFSLSGEMLQEFCDSAWSQVACNLDDDLPPEIRTESGRSHPENDSSSLLNWDWSGWLFGLGWASSGALVTAGLVLLFGAPASENLQVADTYAGQDASIASFVSVTEQSKGPILAAAATNGTPLLEASRENNVSDNKVVYPVVDVANEPTHYGVVDRGPLRADYDVPLSGGE